MRNLQVFVMIQEVALCSLFAPFIFHVSAFDGVFGAKETHAANGRGIRTAFSEEDDMGGLAHLGRRVRCPPNLKDLLLPELCELTCPRGMGGFFGCEKYGCVCKNGGLCLFVGGCTCPEGWSGFDCSEPCPEGSFGFYCEQRCQCMNNALCDRSSGGCNCTAGYQGPLCEEKCPVGSHGYQCDDECKCQNDAICHHVDGSCECTAGWWGPACAERCPEGLFGNNCSQLCDCKNNSTCNFITGECLCTKGFYGENCEIECSSDEWGMRPSQECLCENAECSSYIGNCSCFPGFSGNNCQIPDCPANKWGPNCTEECKCLFNITCHPVTGTCCCGSSSMEQDCSIDKTGTLGQLSGRGRSVIIVAVVIPIVALLLVAAFAMFLRKRPIYLGRKNDSGGFLRFSLLKNEE